MDQDIIIVGSALYLFLVASLAKLGSKRDIGGKKSFLYSFCLTPVVGFIIVFSSPKKDILHIVHYKCSRCGLEFTDYHRNCPSCRKEGVNVRLSRKSMHTY
ncbi:MAG: hypothetical protein JXA03_09910 [Bacteroidales bacterium]|nr:hypothetical protein [Bacteroidales bacterium]